MPHSARMDTGYDVVHRFIIENQAVRGQWVRLRESWQTLCAHGHYPPAVRALLGQAVAASVLLAATLKFRGRLTLQLNGDAAMRLLVAQCTHEFGVRAIARWDADRSDALASDLAEEASFRALTGGGRFTVTIEADERNLRYQGIVPLSGVSLAESLQDYFSASEQLPTQVRLASDAERCGGILVQRLPGADSMHAPGVWSAARQAVARLGAAALLDQAPEQLLPGLLPTQDVRLFRAAAVTFECRCGEGRVTSLLRALGAEEVRSILAEEGAVTVTCEFCGRPYRFNAEAVDALFTHPGTDEAPVSIH
jgi:molecular chaperone Hsp33